MQIDSNIVTNSIKQAISIKDLNRSIKEYIKHKFKHNQDFIDIEARDAFKNDQVTPSIIKYSYGYN